MKKLNLPLLLFLIIGSFVVAVGVHFLHGYQVRRNVDSLLARSEKAAAEGNIDEQITLLTRYCQHRGDDLVQLRTLLKIARENALSRDSIDIPKLRRVYVALEGAVREHPDDEGLRREGFEANVTLGQWEEAIDHAKQLESHTKLSSKEKVALAKCYWHVTKNTEAIKLLSELTGFDVQTQTFDESKGEARDEISAYAVLAELTRRNQAGVDLTLPSKIIDQMVTANPKSASAYLTRADFLQENFKREEVADRIKADIAKAQEVDPDNVMVAYASIRVALRDREFERAASLLDAAVAKHPDEARFYSSRADLYMAMNDTDKALDALKAGLAKLPNNVDLLEHQTSLEIESNRLAKAKDSLTYLAPRLDAGRYQLLNARMLMAEGDLPGAETILEALRRAKINDAFDKKVNHFLADAYRRQGKWDKLASIGEQIGESPEAILGRAEAMQAQGRIQDALKLYSQLLAKEDWLTEQGRQQVMANMVRLRIDEQLRRPEDQREWAQVDKMANVLITKANLSERAREEFRIDLLIRKNELAEARKAAQAAVSKYPNHQAFYLFLHRLTPDNEQATKILDQIEQQFGDSLELRLQRADRIVAEGGEGAVARIEKLVEGTEGKLSLPAQEQLWQQLAVSYERLGALDRSIAMWRRLLAGHANNLSVRKVIFQLAVKTNDEDTMKEMMAEINRISKSDSTDAKLAKAEYQVWQVKQRKEPVESLRAALDIVETARADRPDHAPIHELMSQIYLQLNEPDAAIDALKKAIDLEPGDASYIRQLASVYDKTNRVVEGDRLRALLPEGQKRRDDVISEIRLLIPTDPKKALERAQQVVQETPKDAAALLLLAEVQFATTDYEHGINTCKQLVEIVPQETRPWSIYVRMLAGLGRNDEARALLPQIEKSVPADRQPLLLGQALSAIGDLAAAEKEYEKGLQAAPDDTVLLRNKIMLHVAQKDNERAIAALDQLINAKNAQGDADLPNVYWARRTKAQILNATTAYPDFQAAVALLELNKKPDGEMTNDDLQMWLSYHAHRSEAALRRKALEKLTQLQNARKLLAGEQEVLAFLYKIEGRWDDAKSIMVEIVGQNPNNVNYIGTFVEWLIERGELDDASVWLRQFDANSPAAIRFQALILAKQKKDKEAAKIVLSAVPKKLDATTAAQILEELGAENVGYFKLADQQWKKLVQQKPALIHNYIEFLTRYPKAEKLGDALTQADKQVTDAIAKDDLDTLRFYLSLGLKALRSHRKELPLTSPHYKHVQQWFDLARKSKLDPASIMWSEVDFHDIRRDYGKLESLYNSMLALPKATELEKAVIRNNLAYVYAISNRGAEALETIGDAISQLGPRSDFLDTRGLAYLASGNLEKALADLRAAVAGGDGAAGTYFHLALAEQKSKNVEGAVKALKQAHDLGMTDADLSPAETVLYQQLLKTLPTSKPNETSAN